MARPGAGYGQMKDEIDRAVVDVLEGGNYVLGRLVTEFENQFSSYCGTGHSVGVNSGTDALQISLRALGVGPGDRVITVSHTALATVAAIVAVGARPVLVDIDAQTYTCDPQLLRDAIEGDAKAKAIVPVHLYGNMADMQAITEIGRAVGVPVIEDCAQAAGAAIGTNKAGSFGTIGCFSFYPTKNLGGFGDGGMLVTDDSELAGLAVRLRQYGWNDDRIADRPGLNSRLDEIQAAILLVKLRALDANNRRRLEIAERYSKAFSDLPIETPASRADVTPAYHLYVIASPVRDELADSLARRGIGTAVHYPVPAHKHPGYAPLVEIPGDGLPVTETAAEQVLSLPLYPELSDPEVDQVIDAVIASCDELGVAT